MKNKKIKLYIAVAAITIIAAFSLVFSKQDKAIQVNPNGWELEFIYQEEPIEAIAAKDGTTVVAKNNTEQSRSDIQLLDKNGKTIWNYKLDKGFVVELDINSNDKNTLVAYTTSQYNKFENNYPEKVFLLDEDGTKQWEIDVPDVCEGLNFSPAKNQFCFNCGNTIFFYDTLNGKRLFRYVSELKSDHIMVYFLKKTNRYIFCSLAGLFATDLDGKSIWEYKISENFTECYTSLDGSYIIFNKYDRWYVVLDDSGRKVLTIDVDANVKASNNKMTHKFMSFDKNNNDLIFIGSTSNKKYYLVYSLEGKLKSVNELCPKNMDVSEIVFIDDNRFMGRTTEEKLRILQLDMKKFEMAKVAEIPFKGSKNITKDFAVFIENSKLKFYNYKKIR